MARPREFNESDVLGAAIVTFGTHGFNALSVDAVLKELGLNRSSFYKIFGSKHGLFRMALEMVCQSAEEGIVDYDAKNLVLVALTELAPTSKDVRARTHEAVRLCFNDDPAELGQHVLSRAGH